MTESSLSSSPEIKSLKPTPVYDTYWRFAAERQRIFFRRLYGEPPPWTEDPILQQFKFTNAYRASDRVSQYLIRQVVYRDDLPSEPDEIFFRVMLFKLFNRIETWELLETSVGQVTRVNYSFKRFDRLLTSAMERGQKIYSGAYIMPSGGTLGYDRKHRNHLTLIERMLADDLPAKLGDAPSMGQAFKLFRSYPTLGDFLAYQYATDVNYSTITDLSESEFVVAGPGAVDGIRKCFYDTGRYSNADIIRIIADCQEDEFGRLGIDFPSLWGRRLQFIDCQNLFCEVDKYARIAHPEFRGASGRIKIKQRLKPNLSPIEYWYPPKWSLDITPRPKTAQGNAPLPRLQTNSVFPEETPMDFQTYQVEAVKTDRNPAADEKGVMIPLLGLAGEAGQLLTEYKKLLRDGESHAQFRDRFAEELGDVLWYLADVASKFGLNLSEVAQQNLDKCQRRWGQPPVRRPFDADYPEHERFPRRFLIDFATTHDQEERAFVRVYYKGEPLGDTLTDNSYEPDGYGFHDILHLSFVAVLGWSPLMRKLLKLKRKSNRKVDEVEDGARALYVEEALSTMVFAHAKENNWLEGKPSVSSELLRTITTISAYHCLEVSACTEGEWERAIVQGFAAWRHINARKAGTLIFDLENRSITVKG